MPAPGDGYDHGTWTASHVYASKADLPTQICVVTYDLGLAHPPGPHRISFENNDNSIQWDLTNRGSWNTSGNGPNCAALPPPVLAPPSPPTTVVPVVKTVHPKPAPHTTKPASKVVTTSHPLAFTGFGNIGRLVALLGGVLLLLGMLLYFFDIRRGRAVAPRFGTGLLPARRPRPRIQTGRRLGVWRHLVTRHHGPCPRCAGGQGGTSPCPRRRARHADAGGPHTRSSPRRRSPRRPAAGTTTSSATGTAAAARPAR